jgi:hypothetical protein
MPSFYYLPGHDGVGETLGGQPAVLWALQIAPRTVGMHAGIFGFRMDWVPGKTVVVEACADVAGSNWIPVATNTLTSGINIFEDRDETNAVGRFYRVVPVP